MEEAEAARDAANQVIEQSNVHAPFAGTVFSLPRFSRMSSLGRRYSGLADLSRLQVHAYFDEPEIGDLQLNNPVSIVWDAKPNLKFPDGIIRLPSSIIDYGTRRVGKVLDQHR